jgi:hypothetical protein
MCLITFTPHETAYLIHNVLSFYLFNYLFIYFLPACELLIISLIISSFIYFIHFFGYCNNFFSALHNVWLSNNLRFPGSWARDQLTKCVFKITAQFRDFSSVLLTYQFFPFFSFFSFFIALRVFTFTVFCCLITFFTFNLFISIFQSIRTSFVYHLSAQSFIHYLKWWK